MRVTVTVSAVFTGTAAVDLLEREHWFRCVDVVPPPEPPRGERRVLDLAGYGAAVAAVEGADAVVHLAIGGKP